MSAWLRRALVVIACGSAGVASAQFEPSAFDLDQPAIAYRSTPSSDPVARLNARLLAGEAHLQFDPRSGYLRSLLQALDIPIESQMAVFSKTSLQSPLINPRNPRTIFFNDSVSVAWMKGGFIEVAAHDARQGAAFYFLPQVETPAPQLARNNNCLSCHYTAAAEGVPGFLLRSVPTSTEGALLPWLGNALMDHRTPIAERWGGWYVTGQVGSLHHLGNMTVADRRAEDVPAWSNAQTVSTVADRFDQDTYLSPHSDVVALLVFEHQARAMNLLTRAGWEARVAAADKTSAASASLGDALNELADYLVFTGEVALDGVRGTSGFAAQFTARGPRDSRGRSLRDFDLQHRLMRYPCSYMVYSPAFDALPDAARETVLRRMKDKLSAAPEGAAALEILRETKPNLPAWF